MIEVLSNYPFLLALLAAMLIELSAILVRRAAQTLGGWLWILASGLSILGSATLIWSFLWANTPETNTLPRGSLFSSLVGPLLSLTGAVWLLRSLLILGWQTFSSWPTTHLISEPPYRAMRRPMVLGMSMLAIGLPLSMNQIEGWIWFGVWFFLAQPILELEEWELRTRIPEASAYLDRTPRYFNWPKK